MTDTTDPQAAPLAVARATNQRLNLRAQHLESELAAYRRAVAQWEISEHRTYVPLRTLAVIAKAAGRDIETPQWLLHYQRVEQAEAAIDRVRILHDALDAETGLASPDDQITRGAAARKIAAALDGHTPPAPAAAPSAPADRAALADCITESCDGCSHLLHMANQCPVVTYGERCVCDEGVPQSADVVLPATTDRAAVLREAADRAAILREAAEVAVRAARGCGDSEAGQYAASVAAGIGKELRRMADEAQQPETQARSAAYQTCGVCKSGYPTGGSCGTCAFNARMAAGARQADTAGEQQ